MELQGVIEGLDLLQNISRQVVDEFGDVSRSIDSIKFTIKKVTLALEKLKQELAKRKDQMTVLGYAHADIKQATLRGRISLTTWHKWSPR